jgi:tetratricopeptide (TPR) repeat protein
VIALNRNYVPAYASLGSCKLLIGSIEETIPLQEQAIRLSPRSSGIGIWYWRIGLVHLLMSRIDEALIWLEKARTIHPEHPLLHSFLASGYALKGDLSRTAVELAEARRLCGDDRFSSLARLSGRPKMN